MFSLSVATYTHIDCGLLWFVRITVFSTAFVCPSIPSISYFTLDLSSFPFLFKLLSLLSVFSVIHLISSTLNL